MRLKVPSGGLGEAQENIHKSMASKHPSVLMSTQAAQESAKQMKKSCFPCSTFSF